MTSIVFNSVPLEDIDVNWGSNPGLARVKSVIREIKRYFYSKGSNFVTIYNSFFVGTELLMFSNLKICSS